METGEGEKKRRGRGEGGRKRKRGGGGRKRERELNQFTQLTKDHNHRYWEAETGELNFQGQQLNETFCQK